LPDVADDNGIWMSSAGQDIFGEGLLLPDVAEKDGVCASFSELGVITGQDIFSEDGVCTSFSELGVIS